MQCSLLSHSCDRPIRKRKKKIEKNNINLELMHMFGWAGIQNQRMTAECRTNKTVLDKLFRFALLRSSPSFINMLYCVFQHRHRKDGDFLQQQTTTTDKNKAMLNNLSVNIKWAKTKSEMRQTHKMPIYECIWLMGKWIHCLCSGLRTYLSSDEKEWE